MHTHTHRADFFGYLQSPGLKIFSGAVSEGVSTCFIWGAGDPSTVTFASYMAQLGLRMGWGKYFFQNIDHDPFPQVAP